MIREGAAQAAREGLRLLQRLPGKAKVVMAAGVIGLPVMAMIFSGGDADPPADVAVGPQAPGHYRSVAAVLPVDMESLVADIVNARDQPHFAIDDDTRDLDDALALFAERVDAAAPALLGTLRDGDLEAPVLVAHAAALLAAGDVWGAAGNLLVAHERDERLPAPLLGLAAIGNGQGLPGAALAFADAAGRIAGSDRLHHAAAANNRGHALLLLGRDLAAEAALREALELDPELSEAARNLAHLLMRRGDDEAARPLLPRVAFRLPGTKAPEVRDPVAKPPADGGPVDTGSPEQIAAWTRAPWLERDSDGDSSLRLPLWIALDLSRQGQIAWPGIELPQAGPGYVDFAPRATARSMANWQASQERGMAVAQALSPTFTRAQTGADNVQSVILSMIPLEWNVHPMDGEMFDVSSAESAAVYDRHRTRFQSLEVARAEFAMVRKAQAQAEEAAAFRCSAEDYEACCRQSREFTAGQVDALLPLAREYEDRMRILFRDAYGVSSAYLANLPEGPYLDAARADLQAKALAHVAHGQARVMAAFEIGAPRGGMCLADGPADGQAADVAGDLPGCGPGSTDYSGKWSVGGGFSVEATCGKIKFVAEADVLGTRSTAFGNGRAWEASIGMHAEAEFSLIDGTVTVFAGPKAGVAGKVGEFGGDFGIKDGLYLVVGSDGVRDAGMRVVVGGGVTAGAFGATHDVEVMDFSFVSAL
ncbi:hypothetical protein [Arenimonas composti]|uniref:hypothetical protein n=1 Tax=Arenimonas composti TaxID=370776 RepID=UPI0012E08636|nr:hypothetical protein [Arenimonas composti]